MKLYETKVMNHTPQIIELKIWHVLDEAILYNL